MTPAPVIPERQAQALRERLFAGGMRMFLQPVVDLRSGALMKVEALARLLLADGTIVAPGVFLPLLGDTELDHLFRLGLDIALRQLIELDRAGLAVDVSVNLAPTTLLDKDCSRWVEDALRRHGVAPHRLSLELLETGGMDSQSQDEAIDELVRLGVKLVMDDLGSGYSSLRRLSSLPFHIIKIDQSLTLNLRKTPLLSLPLIRAIIQLGADLERQVVVEGLEDDGMIEAAMILGATLGQGYGLARPMAQEQFLAWHAGLTPSAAAGAIHTYLGALTHHWLYSQAAMLELAPALEHSPLARFFEARGLAGSEPAQWLARCRAEGTGRDTRDQLLAWLMERVREEI
jgi:EAL domain-containing protein (putative c-di-GMP-specific phosphodiesterase class I)